MKGEEWLDDANPIEYRVWLDILERWGQPDGVGPEVCDEAGFLVIFDFEDQARAAVAELSEAGAPLLEVWECVHGEHWHLARHNRKVFDT